MTSLTVVSVYELPEIIENVYMLKIIPFAILAIIFSLVAFAVPDQFHLPEELQVDGNAVTVDLALKIEAGKSTVAKQNRMLLGALLGMAIAGCMGLGAGLFAKRGALIATIVGTILGGLLGGIGGYGSRCLIEYFRENAMDPFVESISIHGSVFVAFGLALGIGGLAGRACHFKTAITILLASVLAATLYPFLAAIIFPLLRSDQFPPDGSINRTLWVAIPVIFFSLVIGRSVNPKMTEKSSSESAGDHAT